MLESIHFPTGTGPSMHGINYQLSVHMLVTVVLICSRTEYTRIPIVNAGRPYTEPADSFLESDTTPSEALRTTKSSLKDRSGKRCS